MKILTILLLLCGSALAQTQEDVDLYNRLVLEWESKGFINPLVVERAKADQALKLEMEDLGNRIRAVQGRINAARAKQ